MSTKARLVEEFRCGTIRAAAMRVAGRKGLEKTTVDDIAREAGVAKGTVYLYFRSRDEILEKTVGAAVDDLLEHIQEALDAARGASFAEALGSALTVQFAYFDEHRDFFRVYFASGEYSEDRRLRQSRRYRRHIDQLVALIRRGRRRGDLRRLDAERAAISIAGAARDLILRRIHEEKPPPPAADARFLTDLVSQGLASRRKEAR